LREEQKRAYDIMCWHLDRRLSGRPPQPLHMIVYGEGGTGKSRVIQTVTDLFRDRKRSYLLIKGAYTGVAASLIDGKTLH
ncbi:uncharacterized protein SCHCODRAFT_02480627, partial [Schizophyllum commune H4-8]|uniref:uncharacterized protein n=1 Tax=Schizophyllum commune (strain H4-8 / FGSC 9210) TaxID=578458 RepID=UPI002160D279